MSIEIGSCSYFDLGPSTKVTLAFDSDDNFYVSEFVEDSQFDQPHRIRCVSAVMQETLRVYGEEARGRFANRGPNRGERLTMPRSQGGISAQTIDFPVALALDSEDNLYVVEKYNHRVLFFPKGSTTATRVYGQGGDFYTADYNHGSPYDGESDPAPNADSLALPAGVALDSQDNLYVADSGNCRVLFYPQGSTTATRVYGQGGSFTKSNTPCSDIRDFPQLTPVTDAMRYIGPGVDADCLGDEIMALALDSRDNLYVLDGNRILVYPPGSTSPARVYGQDGSFTSNLANIGGWRKSPEYAREMTPNGFNYPLDIALDPSDNLYVADSQNGRVVFYPRDSTEASRSWLIRDAYLVGNFPFQAPSALAVDHRHNVYVIDKATLYKIEAVNIDTEFVKRYCPQFNFHPNEKFFPCSIDYLLKNSTLKNHDDPDFAILNPTQQDLYTYWEGKERYYVDINPSQHTGGDQRVLYYWAKRVGSGDTLEIEITYILIYAWQGGQVADIDAYLADVAIGAEVGVVGGAVGGAVVGMGAAGPVGALFGAAGGAIVGGAVGGAIGGAVGSVENFAEGLLGGNNDPESNIFSAIISNYGEHQGDLERVTVHLRQVGETEQDFQIVNVTYEHHGDARTFNFNDFFIWGNHPVAGVGLGQHPTYNPVLFGGRGELHIFVKDIYVGVLVDVISDKGKQWQPWADDTQIIEVGLVDGEPINDQIWAKFQGRFGVPSDPELHSATYLNGDGLSEGHWAALKTIGKQVEPLGLIPSENGPNGLNDRDFKSVEPYKGPFMKPV